MNCKPGDLAVVVKVAQETANCLGKIVRVSTLDIRHDLCAWRYEPTLFGLHGRPIAVCEDECLRPIRPDETPDESIEAMKNLMSTKEKDHAQRETQRNA